MEGGLHGQAGAERRAEDGRQPAGGEGGEQDVAGQALGGHPDADAGGPKGC